jgi:hypothetical protein
MLEQVNYGPFRYILVEAQDTDIKFWCGTLWKATTKIKEESDNIKMANRDMFALSCVGSGLATS